MPVDDWWARDFGPNGIYYGSSDSVGFVDLKYYAGRDNDDKCPVYLSQALGYRNFTSKLNGEGGNLLSDGFGRIYFSDVITRENGSFGNQSPEWSAAQTLDSISNLFNDTALISLKMLNCDGGTGHIDLYVKLIDEQTLIVAKYPDTVTANDKNIIEDNYQYLSTLRSAYNRPFRIYRIPDPTRDDGRYNVTCDSLNFDARTFINGVTANKTFIYPAYSNDIDGNQAQTTQITAMYQKLMPGYKVVPVDSRVITTNGGGGAIHCITMQIPAENPVLFWHPSIDGIQPKTGSYHILAKITNNSGIASAVCKWRVEGNATWNSLTLTDSSGYFIGNIVTGTLSDNDKIDYYLSTTTNNGKIAVKPITAPTGYYTILFKYNTGVNEAVETVTEKNYLFGAYPNPASQMVTIPFDLVDKASVKIVMTDIMGKEVMSVDRKELYPGLYKENIDISAYSSGIYFYSLYVNGEKLGTRKLMLQK
jgi:agmatine/peptidylarginine deiminase